jgi:hypothetical protein
MTALGQTLIVISALAAGIIYGTDVFCAVVMRPALALVDDRTLVSTMGRVHDFGDRRLRVPGTAGISAAIVGTALIAGAGHVSATLAGASAVVALAIWLVIYVRISAPINARFEAAAHQGETPTDARQLQQRWDSVITARSGLQCWRSWHYASRSSLHKQATPPTQASASDRQRRRDRHFQRSVVGVHPAAGFTPKQLTGRRRRGRC